MKLFIFSLLLAQAVSIKHRLFEKAWVNSNSDQEFKSKHQKGRYLDSNNMGLNLVQNKQVTRVVLNEIEHNKKEKLPKDMPKTDLPLDHFKDQLNDQYLGYIYLGNPPQKIKALFDTGSANMVVLTKNIDIGKPKKLFYDETKSKTYKESTRKNKYLKVGYGTGGLDAHFVTDDLRVGSLYLKDAEFAYVDKQKGVFNNGKFQAIVGLAHESLKLAAATPKPIVYQMADHKTIKNKIFAFY